MRLIFAHIPKTAGTSVRLHLNPWFAREERVYIATVGGVIAPKDFGDHALPPGWRFLSGHLRLSRLLSNPGIDPADPDMLLLSFLRDPVDRLISLYNYVLSNPRLVPEESARAQRIGPERFIRQQEANAQTAYLAHPAPADIAWQIMIAPVERAAETCGQALRRVTGKPVPDAALPRRNVSSGTDTPGTITRSDLDPQLLEALHERHARDLALYRAAVAGGCLTALPGGAK